MQRLNTGERVKVSAILAGFGQVTVEGTVVGSAFPTEEIRDMVREEFSSYTVDLDPRILECPEGFEYDVRNHEIYNAVVPLGYRATYSFRRSAITLSQ